MKEGAAAAWFGCSGGSKKKLLICYRGSCGDHFCPRKWEPHQLGIEENPQLGFIQEIV